MVYNPLGVIEYGTPKTVEGADDEECVRTSKPSIVTQTCQLASCLFSSDRLPSIRPSFASMLRTDCLLFCFSAIQAQLDFVSQHTLEIENSMMQAKEQADKAREAAKGLTSISSWGLGSYLKKYATAVWSRHPPLIMARHSTKACFP